MALNFPSSPTVGQLYAIGTKTWKWNGTGWQIVTDANGALLSTKGDLLTFGSALQRKGVGSDGQILMASSAQSDGLVWTPFCGKNAIINGDFNVWQRGTSFTSVADSTYTADRWGHGKSGTGVIDISRSTDVPSVAQAGRLFNFSLYADCTTADASIAAGDVYHLYQYVEGYNWLRFAQRSLVLSFWVKATKTGIYCVSLRNSGVDRSFVGEYTVNAANTWEKKTVRVSASPSAGTWDYSVGIGALLSFCLANGSTRQSAAGWSTGNFLSTSNQVNALDSTSNDFRIVGVQLESGDVATEFESLPFTVQLAQCKRYYLRRQAVTAQNELGLPGYGYVTNVQQDWIDRFDVQMRVAPTFSRSADADFYLVINGSTITAVGLSSAKTDVWGAFLVTNNTTVTSGVAGSLHNTTTSAWLAYDAEL
jgi:hypothetical protein